MKDVIETLLSSWDRFGWLGALLFLILLEIWKAPLRKFYKALDALTSVEGAIHEIKSELKHNGGLSLRDALLRTEQLVQRLAAQAHVGMELHPYGIFMSDLKGNNFYVNRTYANVLGVTKEQLMHRGWEDFVSYTEGDWQDAFDKRRDLSFSIEYRTALGEVRKGRVIATILEGMDGYMGYIIFEHDNNNNTSTQGKRKVP